VRVTRKRDGETAIVRAIASQSGLDWPEVAALAVGIRSYPRSALAQEGRAA
jgi:hypothetical protein